MSLLKLQVCSLLGECFECGQFIAGDIDAEILTVVSDFQNVVFLAVDHAVVIGGQFVLLINTFVKFLVLIPTGDADMLFYGMKLYDGGQGESHAAVCAAGVSGQCVSAAL